MKRTVAFVVCLLAVFGAAPLLLAKGITTRITITSAELPGPVEIHDAATVGAFHIWSGPGTFVNGVEGREGFIVDWAAGTAAERPSRLRTYQVSFYVRYANRPFDAQEDQLAYVVSYGVDPVTGQGFVYLPGKADDHYRLNTTSIYRGREGSWFRASGAWQDAFRRFVQTGR